MSLHLFVGATGTLSATQKQIKKQSLFQDNRLVMSNAKCAVYKAGISIGEAPETHPDFKQALSDADGSQESWFRIFDEFGTHYFSTVTMGARFGSTMIFQNSQYDAMFEEITTAGLEA